MNTKFRKFYLAVLLSSGGIFLHGDDTANLAWNLDGTPVKSPAALKPPCSVTIFPKEINRFGIALRDSARQEFSFSLKDGTIFFDGSDKSKSTPGSADEQVLLRLLKNAADKTYDPSLEKNFDFPYTYGKMGACFDQLTLKFAVTLLERRCLAKSEIDPHSIPFYPKSSERVQVAGLSLLGQGWKEVSKPSDLKPPCTFCSVESVMLDCVNFNFYLIDSQKRLLGIGYGGEKLDFGKNMTESKPGDVEEKLLSKIVRDSFDKIYDPAWEYPGDNDEHFFGQSSLKDAVRVLDLRCKTEKTVPDNDIRIPPPVNAPHTLEEIKTSHKLADIQMPPIKSEMMDIKTALDELTAQSKLADSEHKGIRFVLRLDATKPMTGISGFPIRRKVDLTSTNTVPLGWIVGWLTVESNIPCRIEGATIVFTQ